MNLLTYEIIFSMRYLYLFMREIDCFVSIMLQTLCDISMHPNGVYPKVPLIAHIKYVLLVVFYWL